MPPQPGETPPGPPPAETSRLTEVKDAALAAFFIGGKLAMTLPVAAALGLGSVVEDHVVRSRAAIRDIAQRGQGGDPYILESERDRNMAALSRTATVVLGAGVLALDYLLHSGSKD